jgi:hypothetical protein
MKASETRYQEMAQPPSAKAEVHARPCGGGVNDVEDFTALDHGEDVLYCT